jgi:TrmH family RNA methyltransferase
VRAISSRQNAIVAEYRAAARGEITDTLLLDGVHLLDEARAAGVRLRHVLIAADAVSRSDIATLLSHLDPHTDVVRATGQVMAAVSPVRSASPIVALAAKPPTPHTVFAGPDALGVIVNDIQDPGNVGAIIRVSEAVGASGVVVAGRTADPFGWKALRASMGSALRVPIVSTSLLDDAVSDARAHGARIAATVPRGGTSPFSAPLKGPIALLIGSEGIGLPDSAVLEADMRLMIPMQPPVESLNAAVAAAVLLFEARRQRAFAKGSNTESSW